MRQIIDFDCDLDLFIARWVRRTSIAGNVYNSNQWKINGWKYMRSKEKKSKNNSRPFFCCSFFSYGNYFHKSVCVGSTLPHIVHTLRAYTYIFFHPWNIHTYRTQSIYFILFSRMTTFFWRFAHANSNEPDILMLAMIAVIQSNTWDLKSFLRILKWRNGQWQRLLWSYIKFRL